MRPRSLLLLIPFALVPFAQWARSHTGASKWVQRRDPARLQLLARAAAAHQRSRWMGAAATGAGAFQWSNVTKATRAFGASAATAIDNLARDAEAGGRPAAAAVPARVAAAAAAHESAAAEPRPAVDGCPPSRKPYHTVLTATGQIYQQWQCRVAYYHWKKARDSDPAGECTELTGFTRLVANNNGNSDGIENEVRHLTRLPLMHADVALLTPRATWQVPSLFVKEYTGADLQQFKGYRVINRPHSVNQMLRSAYFAEKIAEEYIFIAETDHLLMQPGGIPNRATKGSPMAYVFNYMGPNPSHKSIINKVWPAGAPDGYTRVQPIGPSPVLIHRSDLEAIARPWNEMAIALKKARLIIHV